MFRLNQKARHERLGRSIMLFFGAPRKPGKGHCVTAQTRRLLTQRARASVFAIANKDAGKPASRSSMFRSFDEASDPRGKTYLGLAPIFAAQNAVRGVLTGMVQISWRERLQ